MKTFIYLLAITMFIFTSGCCGNDDKKESKSEEEVVVTEEIVDTDGSVTETVEAENTEINSCDEFLDRYEAWVDDYLDLLEKFKKNPADPDLAQQYLTVTQELSNWSQEWFKFVDCNDREEYEQRFDAVSDKVDKKMKELGYE